MSYRQLWLFVEGYYDTRFVDTVVRPWIANLYDAVRVVEFASMKREKLYSFLHSVEAMPNSNYLFLKDINGSPCVTLKKHSIRGDFNQRVHIDRTVIVVKEIESWYLAGIDETASGMIGIRNQSSTDDITKEIFISLIPHRFDSIDDFMIEILKNYTIDVARQKNRSFDYFMNKLQV
jgi:hypothetical protein